MVSHCAVLERRNPVLLFRFSGSFLFRLEVRVFLALLFHDPPRMERLSDRRPAKYDIVQNPVAIAFAAEHSYMTQPSLQPLMNFGEFNAPILKPRTKTPEAAPDAA